jgi:hypothetical protein
MTDPIEPIDPIRGAAAVSRVGERRAKERREGERRSPGKGQGDKARLPVPVAAPAASDQEPIAAAVAFAAQLLGQRGQKRGLKGGPKVLKSARATYLETEWSGPEDRRTPTGKITKTEA